MVTKKKILLLIFWDTEFTGVVLLTGIFYLITIGKLGHMPSFENWEIMSRYFEILVSYKTSLRAKISIDTHFIGH